MATVRIDIDTRKKPADGKYNIYWIIGHKSSKSFINSNIKVHRKYFTSSILIKKGAPGIIDHTVKNIELRDELNRILSYISSIYHQLHELTATAIKERYLAFKKKEHTDFNSFFTEVAYIKAGQTREMYINTLKKIEEFHPARLNFSDINIRFLQEFENWMTNKNFAINYTAIQMRNIRHVFNFAIDENIIELNLYPFRKFSIKSEKTKKRNLHVDVIKEIRDVSLSGVPENARNVFMLIFYLIGINLKDLSHLKMSNIEEGRLNYKRFKGGRNYSIRLETEAIELINKLSGTNHLIYLLDHYSTYENAKKEINKKLKVVAKTIDLPELKLSTYYARHSWATIAINNGISKDDIRLCLGHTSNDITDIYLAPDDDLKDSANRKVLDLLK